LAAEYGNDRAVIEIFTHSIHRDMRELSKICHYLLESRNFQGSCNDALSSHVDVLF